MIIDFHTHTFPDQIAASADCAPVRQSDIFPRIPAARRAACCWQNGRQALTVRSFSRSPRSRSKCIISTMQPPRTTSTRLSPICFPSPASTRTMQDWKQELDRIAARNMRGIKLHPAYQQTDLDDPKYLRILERAGALGLIVVTHAGFDIGFPRLPVLYAGKGEKRASRGRPRNAGAGAYGWLVLLGRSSGAACGYPGSAGHGLLAPSGGRSGGRSPMAF